MKLGLGWMGLGLALWMILGGGWDDARGTVEPAGSDESFLQSAGPAACDSARGTVEPGGCN